MAQDPSHMYNVRMKMKTYHQISYIFTKMYGREFQSWAIHWQSLNMTSIGKKYQRNLTTKLCTKSTTKICREFTRSVQSVILKQNVTTLSKRAHS